MTPLLCAVANCDRRAADGLQLCWGHIHGIENDAPKCAVLHDELALILTATGGPGAGGLHGGAQLNLQAADARSLIRTTLTGIALHIAQERGIRLPGSHRLTRLPPGVHGPLNRVWQPNTNKHALGAYIATHHMWLAANMPSAADQLDQAIREARTAAYPNGTKIIEIGQCPLEDEDGQPCPGKIRALIRDEDSLLPKACQCNASEGHVWTADQWHALGRRLHAKPKPLNTIASAAHGHGGWAARWPVRYRIEPSYCPRCGEEITSITIGSLGSLDHDFAAEPQRFGCGCIATGYVFVLDERRIGA
ncbi:MAG TPA: hypothetical protein VFC19_49345 [Candidatus Limnocylindrales bacterium]|nr:hypothetical protein [Candidatus Limnocylindrales bacterium]